MIAAIYARKSTQQFETDPEAKSVHRQIANAKKFAASKGWTVDDAHVYADDEISGAHFLKLAARQRLMKAVKARQVDVVIVRDKSRFTRRDGTDGVEDLMAVAKSGVLVWFYRDGKHFSHGTIESDVMNIFDAHQNSNYRRTIARDVHEALTKRAEAGQVASGKVYGYDNIRKAGHAEYAINKEQAAVVVRVFQMAAKGLGFHRIAKQLTHDGVAIVRPAAAKWTGWSGTTVNRMLHRSIYRGVVTWNKTKKDDTSGKPVITARPKSEWIQRPVPALRIIDESLWKAAHQQMSKRAAASDFSHLRPRTSTADVDSFYLLTGFIRCACGSGMHVRKRRMADGTVSAGYACTRHYQQFGDHICPNVHRWDMDGVNGAVLDAIRLQLTPDRITRLLAHVRTAFDARRGADPADQWRAELAKVQTKIDRLGDAIEQGGGAVPMLVERMKAADLRRQELMADLQSAEGRTTGSTSWSDVEKSVRKNLSTWTTQMAAKTAHARDFFRQAITGPIVLRPVTDGGQTAIRFEGQLALSVLFGGAVTAERSSSRTSVDYTPVFQGIYRADRRPPGRRKAA